MVDRNYYSKDYYTPLLLFGNKGPYKVLFSNILKVVDGVIMIIPSPTRPLTMFIFIPLHHPFHHYSHIFQIFIYVIIHYLS